MDSSLVRILLIVVLNIVSDISIFLLGMYLGFGGGLWIAVLSTCVIVGLTTWHEFMPRLEVSNVKST